MRTDWFELFYCKDTIQAHRGPVFDTSESQKKTLFRIFDGCKTCLTLKETVKSLIVGRKHTPKYIKHIEYLLFCIDRKTIN